MSAVPIISFRDVSVHQNDTLILSNVTFDITKGEFIYLIGKTGSGKSTLLKSLYGEVPLTSGKAVIQGVDLIKINRKKTLSLRRNLGIIFQDFQLLTDRNVEDNLSFVLRATGWTKKNEINQRIDEVLAKVELSDKRKKMPHQLSGGEQQRCAIARALLNDPELILADEPTGNLDPFTTEDIMKLLVEISQNGKTVVVATHDYEMLHKFPFRILRCDNKEVKELPPFKDE
jgi:cell division transport system ATP-binding protein